jgi:hypothetical protein
MSQMRLFEKFYEESQNLEGKNKVAIVTTLFIIIKKYFYTINLICYGLPKFSERTSRKVNVGSTNNCNPIISKSLIASIG